MEKSVMIDVKFGDVGTVDELVSCVLKKVSTQMQIDDVRGCGDRIEKPMGLLQQSPPHRRKHSRLTKKTSSGPLEFSRHVYDYEETKKNTEEDSVGTGHGYDGDLSSWEDTSTAGDGEGDADDSLVAAKSGENKKLPLSKFRNSFGSQLDSSLTGTEDEVDIAREHIEKTGHQIKTWTAEQVLKKCDEVDEYEADRLEDSIDRNNRETAAILNALDAEDEVDKLRRDLASLIKSRQDDRVDAFQKASLLYKARLERAEFMQAVLASRNRALHDEIQHLFNERQCHEEETFGSVECLTREITFLRTKLHKLIKQKVKKLGKDVDKHLMDAKEESIDALEYAVEAERKIYELSIVNKWQHRCIWNLENRHINSLSAALKVEEDDHLEWWLNRIASGDVCPDMAQEMNEHERNLLDGFFYNTAENNEIYTPTMLQDSLHCERLRAEDGSAVHPIKALAEAYHFKDNDRILERKDVQPYSPSDIGYLQRFFVGEEKNDIARHISNILDEDAERTDVQTDGDVDETSL